MTDTLADNRAAVYLRTLWWHSRGDETATIALTRILVDHGVLEQDQTIDDEAISTALRVAVDNPDTRHALAEWCASTETRRTGSSVQNPARWLPQVSARMAARTDPARELRGQHRLALSALEAMAAVDVDESAAGEAAVQAFVHSSYHR